ncbi:MAG: cell division protein FtsQ/DivIB [Roseobacter sp.]
MRSVMGRYRKDKSDPAPSRWAWRLQRLLLTPAFLLMMRAGLPLLAIAAGVIWYMSEPQRVEAIRTTVSEARASFETRPEFMVHLMAIDGADDALSEEIREVLPLIFPMSSFDLDLAALRDQVLALDPVKAASVRVKPGGVLHLDVQQRVPVILWRSREGLAVLDDTGAYIRPVASRADRADLPIFAGDGADSKVAEALAILDAAEPLGTRVQGLERIGERRWDVVLDRQQRLLLPEDLPVEALDRVIALDQAQDILSRDVQRIDLRLGARPTIQMSEFATAEWWSVQQARQ